MGCEKANEQMTHYIYDLCWVDGGMLIAADSRGGQLIKYTIDITTKTCAGEIIEYIPYMSSVSCSGLGRGEVLVSANTETEEVNTIIYEVKTGQKHVWKTGIHESGYLRNSESRDFIIISVNKENYFFNKLHNLLYKVTYDSDFSHFRQTYISNTGVFFGTTYPNHTLITMNQLTNKTIVNKKGIAKTLGVSGTRNGYVYVTAFNGADVAVYSPEGTFLNYLQINLPEAGGYLRFIGALKTSDNEALIAFSTWNDTVPVAIHKIDNQNIFDP